MLQHFKYGTEIVQTTTTLDEDSDGALLELACVKASVVRKSLRQKCLCEFESHLEYIFIVFVLLFGGYFLNPYIYLEKFK